MSLKELYEISIRSFDFVAARCLTANRVGLEGWRRSSPPSVLGVREDFRPLNESQQKS